MPIGVEGLRERPLLRLLLAPFEPRQQGGRGPSRR
jgi:hypothetical protein